ncbi:MAG: hypothetical protein AVDCRST_MAG12-725, partial [uncultured Rubrobacteraceae bacterium]
GPGPRGVYFGRKKHLGRLSRKPAGLSQVFAGDE